MAMFDRLQGLFKKKSEPVSDPIQSDDQDLAERAAVRLAPDPSAGDFRESRLAERAGAGSDAAPDGRVFLPLLGRRPAPQQQRMLAALLLFGLLALGATTFFVFNQAASGAQQAVASGQAVVQSQRLARSAAQALVGNPAAFAEVRESSGILANNLRGLKQGSADIDRLGAGYEAQIDSLLSKGERAERHAAVLLAQQEALTEVGASLRSLNRQSSDLFEMVEAVAAQQLEQNAPPAHIAATGQLLMLTQRIGKSANEFQTMEGVSPEAVFLLGKDMNTFKEISDALLAGSEVLGLAATADPQLRESLTALQNLYEQTRTYAGTILGHLQGLVAAREAQNAIIADSEPLRLGGESLRAQLAADAAVGAAELAALLLSALLVLACAGGLVSVQLQDSRQRQAVADAQRRLAETLEQDAKRVNDANQAAILRLMNELQAVAEGDLTQEATVSEDITGAIADSVNYTVEELRSLVGNVQITAARVASTTSVVESASTDLLDASSEQLREIRDTGQSVLDMAQRINLVSAQAQESAQVARSSLHAAESGLQAVQNAIGGMNAIRDQIQETSKRIKRLGESSQEIGEITELISDITEQTNVLALNAAIQAASAGEAGRGFSVVAEEVQRLAERSADAARQIAALVKAIQTDTQDAVAAMERSTQGVVAGARLSDNAGAALTEIDRVSRRLAELIEQISSTAAREANSANDVAGNIQHIFAVAEQAGESTRSTANQVRELSVMAEELRQSVQRFRIA
ncbi:methyl-accepting chemotaxis protein [Hydrogenophaga sp.]|uniref:methyl-accepting chemotaxis protein n=1 Tax=Hydrogenophaga sp. TaxID=1904254 RepID=UPI0019C5FBE5|nr:methyl-accepting chemotaxis protein [Hydrogenophaga sp.]MBD3893078.1 methyl-accepting chemotaxis protein [Hydrogenophaga sp.]